MVIAALTRGRQLQEACSEAGITEQRFHERVAVDPAFRDACREAIEPTRQHLAQDLAFIEHTAAPEPAPDPTAISAPDPIPTLFSQQMPAWAPTLFGALLAGRPPDAARADAGVTEEQICAEQEQNPLFRQVWRKFQTGPRAGRRAAFDALLDRTIAAAVVATRALPPQIGPEQPRAGWGRTFFRAWRDGRSPAEAARAARVSLEAVEVVYAQNAPFAQACALLALASAVDGQLPQQREQLTAYVREQQEQLAAALRANMPLAEASATVGVAPEIALVWTRTIPEVREAYEEQQRRWCEETLAREAPLAEAFLAALAEGVGPRAAVAQVGWTWAAALQRRNLDPAFAQAWPHAVREIEPTRQRTRRGTRAARGDAMLDQLLDMQFYEIIADEGERLADLAADLRTAAKRRGARIYKKRDPEHLVVRLLTDIRGEQERKAAFLAALRNGASPSVAAQAAGLEQPEELRESDPAFAQAWDEALAEAVRTE